MIIKEIIKITLEWTLILSLGMIIGGALEVINFHYTPFRGILWIMLNVGV